MREPNEIPPALSAEEWRAVRAWSESEAGGSIGDLLNTAMPRDGTAAETCRALAAVFLFGNPHGFTREDVARLRDLPLPFVNPLALTLEWHRFVHDLAARIAALLPPEDA